MAPGRTSPAHALRCLLVAVVVSLGACAPRAASTTESARAAPPNVSPLRQLDWLPADAVAVVHLDVAALRDTDLYRSLARHLPEHPPARSIVERTHSFRIAVVPRGAEPLLAGVFHGDYDEHVNPSALSLDPAHLELIDGREVLVRAGTGDRWFRTPEGFWVVTEPALWAKSSAPPEARPTRLSMHAWTHPPTSAHFLHVAVTMSPLWREQVAASVTDPLLAAMFLPAIEELEAIYFEVTPAPAGGLSLSLGADFTGSRGAQAAAFVLQAGVVAARAHAAGMSFDDGDAGLVSDDAGLGEQLGGALGMLLEDLDVVVESKRLRATLLIPGGELARLREQLPARP
jgi:hypothetical protein